MEGYIGILYLLIGIVFGASANTLWQKLYEIYYHTRMDYVHRQIHKPSKNLKSNIGFTTTCNKRR